MSVTLLRQPAMGGLRHGRRLFSFELRATFTTAGNSESLTVHPERSLTRASSRSHRLEPGSGTTFHPAHQGRIVGSTSTSPAVEVFFNARATVQESRPDPGAKRRRSGIRIHCSALAGAALRLIRPTVYCQNATSPDSLKPNRALTIVLANNRNQQPLCRSFERNTSI